jgi:hypothetical protein
MFRRKVRRRRPVQPVLARPVLPNWEAVAAAVVAVAVAGVVVGSVAAVVAVAGVAVVAGSAVVVAGLAEDSGVVLEDSLAPQPGAARSVVAEGSVAVD